MLFSIQNGTSEMSSKVNGKSVLSAVWGFAEGTIFFILPDVLLSYLALKKNEPIIRYAVFALIGALIGGSLLYWLGANFHSTWWHIIESVPAINQELMQKVATWMEADGIKAILLGPTQGLPYKTFAVQAYSSDISYWQFVVISIPARLLRFLAIAYLARLFVKTLAKKYSRESQMAIWGLVWVVSYLVYFLSFPS